MGNFKEEIARIRAFVFDVDGVFTTGDITVFPDGDFIRTYNSKDGYGVALALRKGYKVAIISGGHGKTLETRFRRLNVTAIYTQVQDKVDTLKEFMAEHGLEREEVIFMGDDLPDIEAMQYCGLAVSPADAVPEVIEVSHYVSRFDGGRGCVRDIIEQVMRARGDWGHEKGFNVIPVVV